MNEQQRRIVIAGLASRLTEGQLIVRALEVLDRATGCPVYQYLSVSGLDSYPNQDLKVAIIICHVRDSSFPPVQMSSLGFRPSPRIESRYGSISSNSLANSISGFLLEEWETQAANWLTDEAMVINSRCLLGEISLTEPRESLSLAQSFELVRASTFMQVFQDQMGQIYLPLASRMVEQMEGLASTYRG